MKGIVTGKNKEEQGRKGDKIVEMNIAAFNAGLEASKKFI